MNTYPIIPMPAMTILTPTRALTKALPLLVMTVLLSTFIIGCGKSSKLKLGDRVETTFSENFPCAFTITKVVKKDDELLVTLVYENKAKEADNPGAYILNTTVVDNEGRGLGKPDMKKYHESYMTGGIFVAPEEKRALLLSYSGAKTSKAPYLIKIDASTPPVCWEIDKVAQE